MPTVLAILPEGFEEVEAVTPIDFLRRAGVHVTVAALADTLAVRGRNGLTLTADTTFAAASDADCDCVFLPGGPGVQHLRASPAVLARLRRQHAAGQWIAAICAAPTVLLDAGVLPFRYTAHDSVRPELPDLIAGEPVVIDGRVITSRGAGTAGQFGLALIAALAGSGKAEEVAAGICWPAASDGDSASLA